MGARTFRLTAALALALAAPSIPLSTAQAAVTDVSASPPRATVSTAGPASVTVNWQVERSLTDLPNPGTVSSANVRIAIGGVVAATLPRSLSASAAGTANTEIVRLHETVQVPQALIYRAIKERSPLTIQRTFADSYDALAAAGSFELRPSGDGSAALTVQRLELAFDDDARSKVLAKGGELRAVAEITTGGVGLLSGQWEVATGSTTAGTPVFRALTLVRQGVGGGGRTVLTSPPLPTAEQGTGLVRFRVIEPALAYETPVLQYYVTPSALAAQPAVRHDLAVAAPRPGEPLTAETRFAWRALAGADAYQLLFYAAPAGPAAPLDPAQPQAGRPAPEIPADAAPAAGIFVPGERSEAVLQPFTLAQLPAGRRLLWQIIAIDANGAEIGSSAVREIYKP
ncbi:MAG: hypothetical protein Kow00114_32120 [Kiloniellaceae bacterium]